MRVFVADGSAAVCLRLTAMLAETQGIEVVGSTGRSYDAARMIFDTCPDAVLLEVRLADGSGLDVLRQLKRDNPQLIVVMLTNYVTPQYRRECLNAQADWFLDKTREFDLITEVLASLFKKRTALAVQNASSPKPTTQQNVLGVRK